MSESTILKPSAQYYVELAKIAQSSFDERRRFEWRVNFSLWAALGLVAYFAIKEKVQVFNSWKEAFYLGLIITVLYIVYQFMVSEAHKTDKRWKHYYLAKAEGEDVEPPERDFVGQTRTKQAMWWFSQIGFTVVMLLFVFTVLLRISVG